MKLTKCQILHVTKKIKQGVCPTKGSQFFQSSNQKSCYDGIGCWCDLASTTGHSYDSPCLRKDSAAVNAIQMISTRLKNYDERETGAFEILMGLDKIFHERILNEGTLFQDKKLSI